jgi:hypothetical protein
MSRVSEDLVFAWCGLLPKSLKSNLIKSRPTVRGLCDRKELNSQNRQYNSFSRTTR